jgi:hypothetical protein
MGRAIEVRPVVDAYLDSAARAATNDARSCELPSDRRGPVRHGSLTGVAHGQGVGRERLAQRGFPVRTADESVHERIPASESKRASRSTSMSTSNTSSAPRPRRSLGGSRSARTATHWASRLPPLHGFCGRAVLATNRQPAHEMPLGRLWVRANHECDDMAICRDFLRGPRRRSNPGPSAYPSVPRSTSQKIRKSSICRNFQAADGTRTHDLLHGKQTLHRSLCANFSLQMRPFRCRPESARFAGFRHVSTGFCQPIVNQKPERTAWLRGTRMRVLPERCGHWPGLR